MRLYCLFAAVLLAGCQSRAEKLSKEYEFLERNKASSAVLCEKSKAVADAFVSEELAQEYNSWSARSAIMCMQAELSNRTS